MSVRELVLGSGLEFTERGTHVLKAFRASGGSMA
jgi:hypothetical protein